jgi:membrane protein YqaA with SNARE-associated domain
MYSRILGSAVSTGLILLSAFIFLFPLAALLAACCVLLARRAALLLASALCSDLGSALDYRH